MINSTHASYSFEDSDRIFGYNHRINITMSSGRVYNIAAEENSKKIFLPKCIRKIFWAKVQLSDDNGHNKTFLVNRNSLSKRTGTSDSLTKFALKTGKKDKNFDSAMRILHQADKLANAMEEDYWLRSKRLKKVGELVKIIEQNKPEYTEKAEKDGGFVTKKKGHTFVVRINPKDPSKTNFYIKQAKIVGKGGYKRVYPLVDYDTQKPKYALSVQKADSNYSSKMEAPLIGYKNMKNLEEFKNIMSAELLYEEGITRDQDDKIVKMDDHAVSYLVTKLYEGTFSAIAKSDKIPLKYKLMLFSQILQGVSDMHSKGLVHCDLKNKNILYKFKNDKFKIKIIDLDLSRTFEKRMENKTSPGTPIYKAPEALSKAAITHPDKLDSWSLGIMLYQLCEGAPVFFQKMDLADKEDWAAITIEGTQNLTFNKLSENDPIRPIIKELLNVDPALRLSVNDAKAAIEMHLLTFS